MTEELENSLQQAIETYLNDRLRAIDEQVTRLHTDMSEALARLRDRANTESLEGSTLSAAIFAHLQTARGQKLTGAAVTAPESLDAGTLKRSIKEIQAQQSQTDVLKALLTGAVQFAERVALFVIRNEQAIGWRICEASDPTNLELIGGVSLPLSSENILTRAVRSGNSLSSDPRGNSEEKMLIDQLGGSPQFVTALPLSVRGKVVAVLYADTTSSDSGAVNLDALEILVHVSAMAVTLVSLHRVAAEPRPEAVAAKPVEAEPEPEVAPAEEPSYAPQVEAQVAEPVAEPVAESAPVEATAPEEVVAEEVSEPPVTEVVAEEVSAPVVTEAVAEEEVSAQPEFVAEPAEAAEPVAEEPEVQAAPSPFEEAAPSAPAPQPAPAAPAFASGYATPLGSRRYGVSEPDLPIEVSEEERRLHNDARRFARLLVSEIKLYNEPKVKEGRNHGDLYDRLREDIDRSRQMYDKRVAPPVAARHDYFHQELVNMLAEGDAAKLGGSYPGAVSAN